MSQIRTPEKYKQQAHTKLSAIQLCSSQQSPPNVNDLKFVIRKCNVWHLLNCKTPNINSPHAKSLTIQLFT